MDILNKRAAIYILETRKGISTYAKGELLSAILWILHNESVEEFNRVVDNYNLCDFGFNKIPNNIKLVA